MLTHFIGLAGMKNKKKHNTTQINGRSDFAFYIFSGFIILFLPIFYLDEVIDKTMMPRLLALSILLFGICVSMVPVKACQTIDLSVLRYKIFWFLTAYLAVIIGSMTIAFNPKESLYDIVKTIIFILLIVTGSILFIKTEKWMEKLSALVLCSALVTIAIGFSQFSTRVWGSENLMMSDGRPVVYAVDGIMSHKNLYSLSLMMLLPFIAFGIYAEQGYLRSAYIVAMVLICILIFLLRTRAVWLGIIISVILSSGVLAIWAKKFNISPGRRFVPVSVIAIILVASILVIRSRGKTAENSYIRSFMSIGNLRDELNTGRVKTWSLTTEMIRDHLLTGVGAGNWQINAPKYYNGRFSENEQLNWIRPHNDFLWVMAEKGIFGLVLFLSVFALTIYYLFTIIFKSTGKDRMFSFFLLSGLTGYLIASAFDFPYERPYHQALLAVYVAGVVAMMYKVDVASTLKVNRFVIVIPLFLVVSFAGIYSFAATRQEFYLRRALAFFKRQDWPMMLDNAKHAISPLKNMDPLSNPVVSYAGQAYLQLNDHKSALMAFSEAYTLYPDKIKSITNLAEVYKITSSYDEAEDLLKKGLMLYPGHSDLIRALCDIYYSRQEYILAYLTLYSIRADDLDSAVNMNIRVLEDQLGIGFHGTSSFPTGDLSPAESAGYYSSRIREDPNWMELIRQKAKENGRSVEDMIRIDAEYMAGEKARYYQSRIMKDSAWHALTRKKALAANKPLPEMIRTEAEYMVTERFNHYKSLLENDTLQLRILVKKAISQKKPIGILIRSEAELMIDQEIKNENSAGTYNR